jgi:molecular chaperone DnaK
MRISGRGFEGGATVSQCEIRAGLPARDLPLTPNGMSFIAGIDLGTTNSLIGVMEAGFPILLADSDGERLTPSAVYFPPAGEPLVGRPALRMRAADPQHTVVSIKRFIGRRIGEESDAASFPLAGRPGEPVRIRLRDRDYSPEEVSACILRKLRADAERALGQPITRAVITVPAYFNDAQRGATKRAGELAGFTVERIVNEPTAAALAYGLDRLKDRSRIAVFDLGGGTFDLSILELNEGVFQVLATNGNTRLGGDDIDSALVEYLRDLATATLGEPADAAAEVRLREAAVAAKHALSAAESARVEVPFYSSRGNFTHELARAELERLARPIVERARAHCLRALADAQLKPEQLDEVILVGGQTRMPLVTRFVQELFGRAPNTSQNPDEAVAQGATIQAGILSGAVQNVVLLDVTPLSLGIETFGGLMNVLIPRNSTIPIKRGELFTNAVAGQRSMLIRVLQGERELSKDNWELGKFELEFESAAKGHARVGVQFEIDANGILHVLARDTKTGQEKVVEMTSAVDVSDEAVEKMLEESLEHAFEDMNDRVFTEAKLKADEMLPAVQIALEQVGSELSAEERAVIASQVEATRAAIAAGAAAPLKKAVAGLDEATQHLAALLVEKAMGKR